mgnify:CR=1 FL=1
MPCFRPRRGCWRAPRPAKTETEEEEDIKRKIEEELKKNQDDGIDKKDEEIKKDDSLFLAASAKIVELIEVKEAELVKL